MSETYPHRDAKMRRKLTRPRRAAPPGSSPGTLKADPAAFKPDIHVIAYGGEEIEERSVESVRDLEAIVGKSAVTWVNVDGLADVGLIRELGDFFGLHRLALEDAVNQHQRPKVEDYMDHSFIVTRMVDEQSAPASKQISMFLGDGFLLTLQDRPGDCFDMVRERIRQHTGIIRDRKTDYLAYALLDAVIDGYFPVFEDYGERLEALENDVLTETRQGQITDIHELKRDLLLLRRAIWPQRDMINALSRRTTQVMTEATEVYLRDCYDHTVQLMEILETYREVASGLVEVHLSRVNAGMNEIMKVLTVIATIFIPLGFIASVYGMNFDNSISPWNMPELRWPFGYPLALLLMAATAGGLLFHFRRRGWIGQERPDKRAE